MKIGEFKKFLEYCNNEDDILVEYKGIVFGIECTYKNNNTDLKMVVNENDVRKNNG